MRRLVTAAAFAVVLASAAAPVAGAEEVGPQPVPPSSIGSGSGSVTAPGLRAAFDSGATIVEAVRDYTHYDTTRGVVYRVVHDPAQLASPTLKFVVVGALPADEFIGVTYPPQSFARIYRVPTSHYEGNSPLGGHFVTTPPILDVGVAFVTP
ncbi:hypothetical protein [Rhodococcus sp. ACT016]|uniref:hypothetical protein n=1 Tax=Rhodococcus sp. ACT016 TaxID=3134808 RepID=UPI003D269971